MIATIQSVLMAAKADIRWPGNTPIASLAIGCGLVVFAAPALAVDRPELKAPDHIASISAEQKEEHGFEAVLSGWSCGPDVIEEIGVQLAELLRRKTTLERQIAGAEALRNMPSFILQKDGQARKNQLLKLMNDIEKQSGSELHDLSERDELELSRVRKFQDIKKFNRGFQHYDEDIVSFGGAAITDGGLTQTAFKTGCFRTSGLIQLTRRLQASATEVRELRARLKRARTETLSAS